MKLRARKQICTVFTFAIIVPILILMLIDVVSAGGNDVNVSVTTNTVSGTNHALFNITENGLAKKNVEIYIDNTFKGPTDSNGTYKVSELTTGSHNWEAKYAGGTVGSGKFVFFGYNILATGTSSPSLIFDYTITAIGSQSNSISGSIQGSNGGLKSTNHHKFSYKNQLLISTDEQWSTADVFYGITFNSIPEPSVSAKNYYGGLEIIEKRKDGFKVRCYVLKNIYNIAGNRVGTWFPNDPSGVTFSWSAVGDIPWSDKETGSSTVNASEGFKYIKTSGLKAPNGDTVWAVKNNNFNVNTVMKGGQLFTNTNYIESWAQNESGTGSISNTDSDKLIAISSLEAPNKDASYSLSIMINGTNVYDNDANDKSNNSNEINYSGTTFWMQFKELHSSMLSQPPRAFIDSISPKLTSVGQEITFNGHGEIQNSANPITAYRWRSHKDGQLSLNSSFNTSSLSSSRHVIYFQVADNISLWSPEVTDYVKVNKPPSAYISSIKGTGVDANGYPTLILGDSITFSGSGIDTDGYIDGYEWESNISGVLSTSESFSIFNLPIGYHMIHLRVKDNDGVWSKKIGKEIVVRRTPVVFVSGYDLLPNYNDFGKISYRPEILDPLASDDIKGNSNLLIEPRTGEITLWAGVLSSQIDKLKQDTGAKRVDIVTFSTGGLEARWFIEKGSKFDVRKFISTAPPHHGLDVADYTWLTNYFRIEGGAGSELIPHSTFLNLLNGHNGCASTRDRGTDHINPYVQYYVIAGKDSLTLEHQHIRINWGSFKYDLVIPWVTTRGDIAIPLDSSRLDGVDQFFVLPYWHIGFEDQGDVKAKVKEILMDDSISNQNTVMASAASVQGNPSLSQKMESTSYSEEDNKTAFNPLAPIFDTIYPSEIKSHTIQIPTAISVIFNLNGLNESDLALISPTGELVNPTDPAIKYTKEDGYIVYEVPNPEIGNWTLQVTALNVPESGSNYSIASFMETNLFVGAGTDKTQYKPNDPIIIYAYAQDDGTPLNGAAIIAEIQGSFFPSEIISLFDDGLHGDGEADDGIYANTYNGSSACGAYNVNVNASILKDGITYNRNAWTTVWVESLPDLSISGSDISFSNPSPEHNDPITITARIHNIGDGDAKDAKILFFDGDPSEAGILIGEKIVDVGTNNSSDVAVQWNSTYGNHSIQVIISPYNNFLEKNYSNNRAQANIIVTDTVAPVADAGPDQIVNLNVPVFFDGSCSKDNVGIANITWDTDTLVDSNGDEITDNDIDLIGLNSVLIGGYENIGVYTAKVTVNDDAGNGPRSDIMNITVTSDYDIEKPSAITGLNQTVSLREPVFFNAGKSSDNFGIASYQWDIDTAIDSDGDGITDNDVDLVGKYPNLTTGYSTLGVHTIKLSTDDTAGNGPVNANLSINVIDKVAPTTTLTLSPLVPDGLNGFYITSPNVTLSSVDDNGGSDVAKIEYSFDGTSWITYLEPFTIETKGNTIIYYKSSDNSGNVETVKSESIKVDSSPFASAGGPYTSSTGSLVILSGSNSYDEDDNIVTYEWDLDGDGIYNDATGENVEYAWNEPYSGEIGLRVTDSNGATGINKTKVEIAKVEEDNIPPIIHNVTLYPENKTTGSKIKVNVNVTDNINVIEVTAGNIQLTEIDDIWQGEVIAPGAAGNYSFRITAKDPSGNSAETEILYTVAPRQSISELQVSSGPSWINLTWKNPTDPDFNYTEIYLNGIFQLNTSSEYFNATNLHPGENYTFSTRTVYLNGYINEIWVNSTLSLEPQSVQVPIANFSSDTTSGYPALAVQFIDLSTRTPNEWYWDFGDGESSGLQNPIHTYFEEGNYTVTLDVSNPEGNNNTTKIDYIQVKPSSSVKLTSVTLDPENSTGVTTNAPGAWTTSLGDPLAQIAVKNDNGVLLNQMTSETFLGDISIPLAPGINNFTLAGDNIFQGNEYYGAVLFFDGVTTPPQISVYNSNGGIGNFSVQPEGTQIIGSANGGLFFDTAPGTHIYTAPDGTKVEVLSFVIDSINGTTDEISWGNVDANGVPDTVAKLSLKVTLPSLLPVADFSLIPDSGIAPLTVRFADNSTGRPSSWYWDFGDGTSNSSNPAPEHVYTVPGTYNVSLTVANANGADLKSETITVLEEKPLPVLPAANIDSNVTSGYAPLSVKLIGLLENATGVTWDFGDGNNSFAYLTLEHLFTNPGTYNVSVNTINENGTGSKLVSINVLKLPTLPDADFESNITSGSAPLTVGFTDLLESTTERSWDFGDGTGSIEQNPVHTYKAGKYTVTLTARNIVGSNAVTKYNYIYVGTGMLAPVTAFSASPTSSSAPLNVSFTDNSTGSPTSWKWNFGDGTTSIEQNPMHTYTKAGQYTVTLTTNNAVGSNMLTKYSYINAINAERAPITAFSASPTSGNAPLIVNFIDNSTNVPNSWKWTFGDGNVSTEQNPVHVYGKTGKFNVTLTAKNAAGSNAVTKSGFITVSKAA